MFLRKSSHRSKKRRTSYLFYCFDASVVAENGDLEIPVASAGKVRKRGAACFPWSWFRRKKKPSKVTCNSHGAKAKIYRSRSTPPAPPEPTKFSALHVPVNTEPHPSRLPQLTPNRTESPNLQTEPVSDRRKSGLPEPDKHATPPQFSTQARPERARKLDSKAGLTVIAVTIAVMVFYGRVAAVVSLCACFYLVAILREVVVAEVAVGKMDCAGDADVDSEEYKKRVVMEGLLYRSKRRPQTHK